MLRWLLFFSGIGLALVSLGGQTNSTDSSFASLQRRVGEVFQENADGVLRIKSALEEPNEDGNSLRVGTGFIISRDGHILTNASIAYGAIRVWAEHRGVPYRLEVLGHDLSTNLSLLKFVKLPKEFKVLSLEAGNSPPNIGSILLGITMPLEFDPTPSWGLLTGRESYFGNRFFPTIYLRTGLPAAPGAGGSPVFDLQGQFVGMIVASLPDLGSSYVLPARALLKIRDDLIFNGKVDPAFLGIEINEQTGVEIGRRVVISDILKGGPADRAGIQKEDVLVEFFDRPIGRFDDFVETVFFARPGQVVSVVVKRGDDKLTLSMKVESQIEWLERGDAVLQGPPAEVSIAPGNGPEPADLVPASDD